MLKWKKVQQRCHQSGFTLLEVMVAIAILAIALTVLLGNQSQSLRLAEESRFSLIASLLIREKFTELELSEDEIVSSEGDFGQTFPGYYWSVEVDTPVFDDLDVLTGTEQYLQQLDLRIYTTEERQSIQVRRLMHIGKRQ